MTGYTLTTLLVIGMMSSSQCANICRVPLDPFVRDFRRHMLQTPRPSPKPAPKPSPSPAYIFKNTTLNLHNSFRKRHRVSPLVWNNTVAISAQRWADRCMFMHQRNSPYGENLYWSSVPQSASTAGTRSSTLWYNEVSMYNYRNARFSPQTGHFTCMVWKSVKALGCAMRVCPDRSTLVVCRYWPHCNIIGRFAQNVLPP